MVGKWPLQSLWTSASIGLLVHAVEKVLGTLAWAAIVESLSCLNSSLYYFIFYSLNSIAYTLWYIYIYMHRPLNGWWWWYETNGSVKHVVDTPTWCCDKQSRANRIYHHIARQPCPCQIEMCHRSKISCHYTLLFPHLRTGGYNI